MKTHKYNDELIINIIRATFLTAHTIETEYPELMDDFTVGGVTYCLGNGNMRALELLSSYAKNKIDDEDFSLYSKEQLKNIIDYSDEIVSICLATETPSNKKIKELQIRTRELYSRIGVIVQVAQMTTLEQT